MLAPGTGALVGTVTDGAPPPALGHPVAGAYFEPPYGRPGIGRSVDVRGRHVDVEVVAMPFIQR